MELSLIHSHVGVQVGVFTPCAPPLHRYQVPLLPLLSILYVTRHLAYLHLTHVTLIPDGSLDHQSTLLVCVIVLAIIAAWILAHGQGAAVIVI